MVRLRIEKGASCRLAGAGKNGWGSAPIGNTARRARYHAGQSIDRTFMVVIMETTLAAVEFPGIYSADRISLILADS